MDAAYAAPGSPTDRIRGALLAYARFAVERPEEFRLLAEPPDAGDALEQLAEVIREQNGKLADAIQEGIEDGSIRPDLDPGRTATALWAASNGLLALAWRGDSLAADPSELLPDLARVLEFGLVTNEGRPRA